MFWESSNISQFGTWILRCVCLFWKWFDVVQRLFTRIVRVTVIINTLFILFIRRKTRGRGSSFHMNNYNMGENECVGAAWPVGMGGCPPPDLTGVPDLDHQRLPQVPVLQLPGLWQEEIRLHLWGKQRPTPESVFSTNMGWQARGWGRSPRTYADGVQVLKESQFCLFTGREELPMSAIGWQSCWDSKKATIWVTASCTGGTSHQEGSWRVSQTYKRREQLHSLSGIASVNGVPPGRKSRAPDHLFSFLGMNFLYLSPIISAFPSFSLKF